MTGTKSYMDILAEGVVNGLANQAEVEASLRASSGNLLGSHRYTKVRQLRRLIEKLKSKK